MKYALVAFGAALLGALAGVYAGLRWFDQRGPLVTLVPDAAGIVRARELILTDKQNHTFARLASTDGFTTLQFFDTHNEPLMDRDPLMQLSAGMGEASLNLANRNGGPRISLGPLYSDTPGEPPEFWGLEIQKGLFDYLHAGIVRGGSSGIRINHEKGDSWSAP